ncbi:Gfo/Idh/MocA family protein [Promicromonospora sp. NPDC052451]|uniref:Gfo/Idh/MocA family protein n=1 Tax=Promicromonospora sp. NPDC052451 TaxID=3364407 RepID=UPI0037CA495B
MKKSPAPLRAAVVGAGGIARGSHLPALAALGDRATVVALVDVDTESLHRTADDWSVPGRYTDLDAMLRTEHPDLVVVATPPGNHRETAVAALDAGAWVWCEKPPALSLAEYDEIAAHEREGGPYAAYVFQHRFGSGAERLRAQLTDGSLGRPLVAVCHTLWYRPPAYFDVPWRGRWETEGGGPTMGHGIHQMDLLLSLLGDWHSVTAEMATLDRDVRTEDISLAMVRFSSGVVCSVVNSLLSPRQSSYLRFDLSDATVEVEHLYGYGNDDWRWTPAPHVTDTDRVAGWPPADDVRSSHAAQLASLVGSFERGERPRASGADGRRSLELITGMYRSALTGRTVLRSELTGDDPFVAALHGGDPEGATRRLHAGARPDVEESSHA